MATKNNKFPTGYYDKHLTKNPIAKYLLKKHYQTLKDFLAMTGAKNVLEIGCGRGAVLEQLSADENMKFTGCDTDEEALALGRQLLPKIEWVVGSVYAPPFEAGRFDAVILCEILEHLKNPEEALSAVKALSPKFLILSVPREPLWRVMNLARGAYIASLGNTPGHIQHFSKRAFCEFVSRYFEIIKVRTPIPWTMALAKNF